MLGLLVRHALTIATLMYVTPVALDMARAAAPSLSTPISHVGMPHISLGGGRGSFVSGSHPIFLPQ